MSRTMSRTSSIQGLVKQTGIADPDHNLTQVVTLTKEGHRLLSRGKVVSSSQAIYHGLKKPKEAFHDTDLYRLYYKAADDIERRGGRVIRVRLDYELKQELYSAWPVRLAIKTAIPRRCANRLPNDFT